ncbi:FAD/NAD(P)-binding domain-containing protein [Hypoxylon sp. FL0890]|nr:FAD/NAD(P)-binding domain-containing protein [Hypoxylon sp. FL0890]
MAGHRPGGDLRVAVIGAGIAGCCLTVGLSRNSFLDVHLYEAYPNVGVRGTGLALHGNAIKAIDLLTGDQKSEDMEMASKIIVGSRPHTGTLIAELGRAKGRRTVHRAHFIQGLLEDVIPEDCVHFGKCMVGIEQGGAADANIPSVSVTFADGKVEKFDVLFGSEEVKSLTRKFILGIDHPATDAVNHDGWRCFNSPVPMAEAKKVVPRESIEKVRMFCTPLGYTNGLPLLPVTMPTIGGRCCSARNSKPSYLAPGIYGNDSFLLERDPKEDWKIQDHDHAPIYYYGRVAMIGDAAHATGPHAGNGAAQAIEDAAILTRVFAQVKAGNHINAALKAFDEIRRPRSQRNEEERNIEDVKRQMEEGGMYTNGVDVDAQVQAAVLVFETAMLEVSSSYCAGLQHQQKLTS